MSVKHPHANAGSLSVIALTCKSHRNKRTIEFVILTLLPIVVICSGCEEPRVPVFPVSGRVTFQGKPAKGAKVVLGPLKRNEIDDVSPTAEVQADGTFNFTSYDVGDGAPAGDYVATVVWFKQVGQAAGPNILPKEYASPATSPLKVSVSGPTEIPPIAIK